MADPKEFDGLFVGDGFKLIGKLFLTEVVTPPDPPDPPDPGPPNVDPPIIKVTQDKQNPVGVGFAAQTVAVIPQKTTDGPKRYGKASYSGTTFADPGQPAMKSVFWGDKPMTLLGESRFQFLGGYFSSVWGIVDPPTEPTDITANFTGNAYGAGVAESFNNVDPKNPVRSAVANVGGNSLPDLTAPIVDWSDMLGDCYGQTSQSTSPGPNQIGVFESLQNNTMTCVSVKDGGYGGEMSWGGLAPAQSWAGVVVALSSGITTPAGTPPPPPLPPSPPPPPAHPTCAAGLQWDYGVGACVPNDQSPPPDESNFPPRVDFGRTKRAGIRLNAPYAYGSHFNKNTREAWVFCIGKGVLKFNIPILPDGTDPANIPVLDPVENLGLFQYNPSIVYGLGIIPDKPVEWQGLIINAMTFEDLNGKGPKLWAIPTPYYCGNPYANTTLVSPDGDTILVPDRCVSEWHGFLKQFGKPSMLCGGGNYSTPISKMMMAVMKLNGTILMDNVGFDAPKLDRALRFPNYIVADENDPSKLAFPPDEIINGKLYGRLCKADRIFGNGVRIGNDYICWLRTGTWGPSKKVKTSYYPQGDDYSTYTWWANSEIIEYRFPVNPTNGTASKDDYSFFTTSFGPNSAVIGSDFDQNGKLVLFVGNDSGPPNPTLWFMN